ncbi:MAG: hypothetical protein AB7W59_22665 [Acidimicrobiia bacterium]
MEGALTIPGWAQGRPGLGQGGYSAARFAQAVGEPVAIDLRAPIPLERTLEVATVDGGWELRDGATVIMQAQPRAAGGLPRTDPVAVPDAAEAMSRFPGRDGEHEAVACFSCGLRERTMGVWPGPLADGSGRVAARWTPPPWVGDEHGVLDDAVAWTAMDCAQGFFVGYAPERRRALTVRYLAEVYEPIRVGDSYTIVGFDGEGLGWQGRKRAAAANVFAADGRLVAAAASLWVEPRPS